MYAVDVFFYDGTVYLNRRQSLRSNELLTRLLNMDFGWAAGLARELNQLAHSLRLESDMRQDDIEEYDRRASRAQQLIRRLDGIAGQLDLYQKSVNPEFLYTDKLFDCLTRSNGFGGRTIEMGRSSPARYAGPCSRRAWTMRWTIPECWIPCPR